MLSESDRNWTGYWFGVGAAMMNEVEVGRRYLITVGTSFECQHMGLRKLQEVENDIEKVKRLFEAQGYEILADVSSNNATAHTIKTKIREWFSSGNRNSSDIVVLYFAGHGGTCDTYKEDYYLYTFDSMPKQPDTAVEIKTFVKSFLALGTSSQNVLLILDACYSGSGGSEISKTLSQLPDIAPEGSGFWILSSAGSNDKAVDGAFVEALENVLNSNFERSLSEKFISLDTLVGDINDYFRIQYENALDNKAKERWKQGSTLNVTKITKKAEFIQNLKFLPCSPVQNLESQNFELLEMISKNHHLSRQLTHQQIALLLQKLDYEAQQDKFDDFLEEASKLDTSYRSGVFLLEVSDDGEDELQKFLVNRLSRSLVSSKSPKFQENRVNRRWQRSPIQELLKWLGPELGLPLDSNLEKIHDHLLELCQTQPVLIVLYRVPEMGNDSLSNLLKEFWLPLQKKMKDRNYSPCLEHLILFLTGAKPMSISLTSEDLKLFDHEHLKLDNITKSDVKKWHRLTDTKQLINRLDNPKKIDDDLYEIYRDKSEAKFSDNAYGAIQIVCNVLGFPDGLLEFDWKLSGDIVV
jgi:hypothetical protein